MHAERDFFFFLGGGVETDTDRQTEGSVCLICNAQSISRFISERNTVQSRFKNTLLSHPRKYTRGILNILHNNINKHYIIYCKID